MRLNTALARPQIFTNEGAKAKHISPEQQLRRSVLSCLLWEKEFYEDGQSIADRITETAAKCSKEFVAALAIEARNVHGLRHAPLMLLLDLIRRGGPGVAEAINATVRRADELGELVALYWRNGKKPLSKQMKTGLAMAFGRFNEYALAKYDRDGAVRLRDVLFLTHAKPKDEDQAALFKRVAERQLVTPDTWEVALSGGADKKETFERLIRDGKLGYLALLRNLRNMVEAGCDLDLVREAIIARKGAELVWPFRYIAAAKACPQLEPAIDQAFCEATSQAPRMSGKTLIIIDVSGSMYGSSVSAKSDMNRALVACALGAIGRNVCSDPLIYATAGSDARRVHQTEMVPARSGMALVDAIYGMCRPLGGGGIFLNQVMRFLRDKHPIVDRVIVITDEQDYGIGDDSPLKAPAIGGKANYMINVASARNGIGYKDNGWTHIDGFSEAVIRFITESENDGR